MSDSISRANVIDTVRNAEVMVAYDSEWSADVLVESVIEQTRDCITENIKSLPSADRPTGEWMKSNLLPNGYHCSNCDAPVMTDDITEMLYCTNCGAKMDGESDG